MNTFTVNLSTIFTEVPLLERFKKAKECGFSHVEIQFPYELPVETIAVKLKEHQLTLELINVPAGNWEKGERGIAIYPDRINEFKEAVAKGIEYATALGVSRLHCLAGVLAYGEDRETARKAYLENLGYAARKMARHGLTLLIEPINPFDMPGYFLTDIEEAAAIVDEIGCPNVKLQFDFYHIQRIQGNLLGTFDRHFERIAHVQLADVPGRHEPGTGEINYQNVLEHLEKKGYKGYIGLEYIPAGKSEESFKWMNQLGTGCVAE
jgi:hydroxypyruvate isomerase